MAGASRKGVVAAGHPLTAAAAAEVLEAGGNAVDAAVCAFFMACVVEPVLASLGGGGFLMEAAARQAPTVYDFFTHTPQRTRPAAQLDFEAVQVDFGSAVQVFHIGYGTVAAPGAVAGILGAHRAHGTMPLPELAAPAVAAARRGVAVSATQALVFELVEPIYVSRPSARALFESPSAPGRALREGDKVRFTDLADVMEVLAIEGPDFFYRGEIAALILRHTTPRGCLDRRDLAAYEVLRRKPLERRHRGAAVFTNPPPSCGGILVMFGLALLERLLSKEHGFGSRAARLTLARVLERTAEARLEAAPQADGACPDPALLLDPALLARYEAEVRGTPRARRGTTHISIIDRDGGAVALTVTNGEGCGEVLPGAGFMLNNMLGEEDLNPGGAGGWRTNRRLASMMAPTMVQSGGGLIVTGSGGSNRIPSAILQLLSNVLDHGMDVERAVRAPRLHWHDGVLYAEDGDAEALDGDAEASDDEGIAALRDAYPGATVFPGINFFFGGCNTAGRSPRGCGGCGDPRRGGVAVS